MTLHSWWMTNDFKGHSADSELPEGEEYDMLELRVGDIEDAWENFVEDQEKTRD